MAKSNVMALTDFRYENYQFYPINLMFVNKTFDIINFSGIIRNTSFDSFKDYYNYILSIAQNNGMVIDYNKEFDNKFYNICFRNIDISGSTYNKYAYIEV